MTTNTATVAELIAKWTPEAYRAMDAKGKGKVRSTLNRLMLAAFRAHDTETGEKVLAHLDTLKAAPTPTKSDVPVETAIAVRIATLRTAADLLESGEIVPIGMERDESDDTESDETYPNVTAIAEALETVQIDPDAARCIASARIGRKSPDNDIADVILNALHAVPKGTELTMAAVANTKPGVSDGAVAQRLFTKNGPKTGESLTGKLFGTVVAIPADADHPVRRVRLA